MSDKKHRLDLEDTPTASGHTEAMVITAVTVDDTPQGNLRVKNINQLMETPHNVLQLQFWDVDDFISEEMVKPSCATCLTPECNCKHKATQSLLNQPSPIQGPSKKEQPNITQPALPSKRKSHEAKNDSGSKINEDEDVLNEGLDIDGDTNIVEIDIVDISQPVLPSKIKRDEKEDDSESEIDEDDDFLHEVLDSDSSEDDVEIEIVDKETLKWRNNFDNFKGKAEKFTGKQGPTISSTDPYEIFTFIWDRKIIDEIVRQTNLYAWQEASKKIEDGTLTRHTRVGHWVDVTFNDIYVYFSLIMHFAFIPASRLSEHWRKNTILRIPDISEVMSRDRFMNIAKNLHFIDIDKNFVHGSDRKLAKIRPILDHCNKRFAQLYKPGRFISIDESLWMCKGYLSFIQYITAKVARYGIKTYELCESLTGYLYKFIIYVGKETSNNKSPNMGLNKTSQIVLELLEDFYDQGYCIVTDNFYTGISLAKHLKGKSVDVIGTLQRNRKGVPQRIKELQDKGKKAMTPGSVVSMHSGDLSVTAWKDTKIVTILSTYHKPDMAMSSKARRPLLKPQVVLDYNKTMGGVDIKNQMLSMYPLERKRSQRWYIKLFKRLVNTSIFNSFVVYRYNKLKRGEKPLSHRAFRYALAKSLLDKHSVTTLPVKIRATDSALGDLVRLDNKGGHDPYVYEERNDKNKTLRHRCKCCSIMGVRKQTKYYCKKCNVPLCVGNCWTKYHSMRDLGAKK